MGVLGKFGNILGGQTNGKGEWIFTAHETHIGLCDTGKNRLSCFGDLSITIKDGGFTKKGLFVIHE